MTGEYWQQVRDEADRLGTDGCSLASAAFRDCCRRHDVEYRTGCYVLTDTPITRKDADRRFLACMQNQSIFGYWSPMAWTRYWAVRWFGGSSWKGKT